jgi:flagellar basal body rod protein FlgF
MATELFAIISDEINALIDDDGGVAVADEGVIAVADEGAIAVADEGSVAVADEGAVTVNNNAPEPSSVDDIDGSVLVAAANQGTRRRIASITGSKRLQAKRQRYVG